MRMNVDVKMKDFVLDLDDVNPQKIKNRTKEVKEVNKKLGGRLSAMFTAVHSPLCVSLYPKHVHMSNTPDSFPEQQVQPPTSTPTAPPRSISTASTVWRWGCPPEQKLPPLQGFLHCPRHTVVYLGLWKGAYSVLSPRLHLMSLLKACFKRVKYKH